MKLQCFFSAFRVHLGQAVLLALLMSSILGFSSPAHAFVGALSRAAKELISNLKVKSPDVPGTRNRPTKNPLHPNGRADARATDARATDARATDARATDAHATDARSTDGSDLVTPHGAKQTENLQPIVDDLLQRHVFRFDRVPKPILSRFASLNAADLSVSPARFTQSLIRVYRQGYEDEPPGTEFGPGIERSALSENFTNDWNGFYMGPGMHDSGIRNQGPRPTCTAFSVVAALENLARQEGHVSLSNLSEEHLWSRYQAPYLHAAIERAKNLTVVEQMWPYGRRPMSWPKTSSSRMVAASLGMAPEPLSTLEETLVALQQGFPVVISLPMTSAFETHSEAVITGGGHILGHHALTISGARLDSNVPGGGYFVVKNSWGKEWGISGYGRLSFGYCQSHTCRGVAIKSVRVSKISGWKPAE